MLVGLLIAAGGAFSFAMAYRQALAYGEFGIGGIAGPALAVLGVALVLFPGYRQERLERGEDISSLRGLDLLTSRWKAVLVVALLAGLAGYIWLSGWFR
jgi:hypothetical protein